VRGKRPTKNHLFAAIFCYVQLQTFATTQAIMNRYQIRRELFKNAIAPFISGFTLGKESLNPLFCLPSMRNFYKS
jgi:hypothetical protein